MTMADIHDRPLSQDNDAQEAAPAAEDTRKPYEAPRLLKKRSVARATLFTAMGVMASGLTTMG
jgi:hypothetical protein